MLSIFVFMAWILVLVTILSDLFRDHDTSGWMKAVWVLCLIFIPFLTALIYLSGSGMRERSIKHQQEAQSQFDAYVRQAGGTSSADRSQS